MKQLQPLQVTTRVLGLTTLVTALVALGLVRAGAATAQSTKPKLDLEKAVGILELRIEMAENSLKFFKTPVNMEELISSLEEYLNNKCFGAVHKKLEYKGQPTDPTCVGYMDRLLQLNPDNPAAICLRDGIAAPSCVSAYQNQRTSVYYPSSSDQSVRSLALKSGMSALEIDKLEKLTLVMKEVNSKYQSTEEDAEKLRLMDDALALYDQMLALACRITAVRFNPRSNSGGKDEDPELKTMREKLLKIPPKLREEHQERMMTEVENRFAAAKGNILEQARLKTLMEMIRNPSGDGTMTANTNERERLILPKCKEVITQALATFPQAPAPVCHQNGWFTPNCIQAIRLYRADLRQKRVQAEATAKASTSPGTFTPEAKPRDFHKF